MNEWKRQVSSGDAGGTQQNDARYKFSTSGPFAARLKQPTPPPLLHAGNHTRGLLDTAAAHNPALAASGSRGRLILHSKSTFIDGNSVQLPIAVGYSTGAPLGLIGRSGSFVWNRFSPSRFSAAFGARPRSSTAAQESQRTSIRQFDYDSIFGPATSGTAGTFGIGPRPRGPSFSSAALASRPKSDDWAFSAVHSPAVSSTSNSRLPTPASEFPNIRALHTPPARIPRLL